MEDQSQSNSLVLHRINEYNQELANSLTHAIGIPLSIAASICLIMISDKGNFLELVSIIIFGFSMLLVYTASTLYHSVHEEKLKEKLLALDHIAIYVVISGTYTPFLLLKFNTTEGWIVFIGLWTISIVASIIKWVYRHDAFKSKYNLISTLLYLFMGWGIIFFLKPLIGNLEPEVLRWLLIGGVSYTVGVVFYLWDNLPFSHAVWHLFVLTGSGFHIWAVYKLITI